MEQWAESEVHYSPNQLNYLKRKTPKPCFTNANAMGQKKKVKKELARKCVGAF